MQSFFSCFKIKTHWVKYVFGKRKKHWRILRSFQNPIWKISLYDIFSETFYQTINWWLWTYYTILLCINVIVSCVSTVLSSVNHVIFIRAFIQPGLTLYFNRLPLFCIIIIRSCLFRGKWFNLGTSNFIKYLL